ncbi:MAG: helix-turn-helix transcriptional regulator [Bacteroidales bacterium]|nr:helix-turn-helix transcriptional regulator [Bacteroidales bacterium]
MYSFLDILHFTLIIIPIIFALQLLTYSNKDGKPHKILGTLMIFVSIYYFNNAKFICSAIDICQFNLNFLFFLFLCITPFYYIYTKSLTTEAFGWDKKHIIHFVPAFLILVVSVISNNFINAENTTSIISFDKIRIVSIVVYNLQIFLYSVLMFITLNKHNKKIKQNFSYENHRNNLNWLKIFLIIFMGFSILDLAVFYFNPYLNLKPFYYVLTNGFFIFLGYFGLKQNDIYYALKTIPVELVREIPESENLPNEEEEDKNQYISEEKVKEIYTLIIDLLDKEQLYKKQDLSIFDIADKLQINKTYISHSINKNTGSNFSNLINKYRIEESKNLLLNSEFDNYTIEAIANHVGFHSKSSFNSWFKSLTGQTPSVYKKSLS